MNYGSSTPRRLAAVPESVELDSFATSLLWQSSYRDTIRSVSIGAGRSARFYPRSDGDAERASSFSSSASSTSLLAASYSGSGLSSTDGMSSFRGWGAAGFNGVHELRGIALQMLNDGYIRGIIQAFSGGSSVEANGGGPDHEKLIVERWLSELDVEWILHLGANSAVGQGWSESPSIFMEEGAERRRGAIMAREMEDEEPLLGSPTTSSTLHTGEGKGEDMVQLHLDLDLDLESLRDLMERWIRALLVMVHVLFITYLELRAKRSTVGGVRTVRKTIRYIQMLIGVATPGATGETASSQEEEVTLFARFAEVSVLRMLTFVDAVCHAVPTYYWAPEALPGMLQVYACVADASPTVLALFKQAASSTTVFEGMNAAFLRKRTNLSNTIWSLMGMVRASFFTEDCCRISLESSGPGVHETTRLMMNYIALLWSNQGALNLVLQDHHFSVFVSEDEGFNSVVSLIIDMISSLEKHLVDASHSIAEHGLRYIFLMNNCDFITQQVRSLDLPAWFPSDDSKIQGYIDAYLHASWTPVLSCLYVDIPFGPRRYASLSKFESQFNTICDSHRLWKVPDPELRKRLRKAIIEKVIPWYARYLEQRAATGRRTTSRSSTPHQLQEVLEELFEG
jgi:hypothetical protein